MAYTPAEWAKLQAGFPPEDKITYAQYIASISGQLEQLKTAEAAVATPAPIVDEQTKLAAMRADTTAQKTTTTLTPAQKQAAVRKLTAGQSLTDAEKAYLDLPTSASKATTDKAAAEAAAKLAAEDAYYTQKVGSTGKTQAQLDAAANAAATATLIGGTVDPKTGKVIAPTPPPPAKTAAQIAAELKAKQEAEAKAAADAAAKAAAEAAAKAEADRIAAEKAAAEAKAAQAAADKALQDAKTAAELEAAKKAAMEANAKAEAAAKALEELKIKAEKDAKDAADKAEAELKAALEAKDAAAIKAAQEAKAAADKALQDAKDAAAQAAAEAEVATAGANINVTGNTLIPFGGKTEADLAAKIAADEAAAKLAARQSTIKILTDRFNQYNLGSLATKIKDLAIDGANEATITLDLQETPEYKERFKANEIRAKKGLAVLDPGIYLKNEDAYRQVLRAYGLKQFDTDNYVSQFIANDMSPTEFSNRVVTAVQRVQNADPAIVQQLRDYYGIGQQDLVAYVLDPEQQFQKIERQVAASEIGVAAARQGLTAGVSVAEQLAAQGVSQAEAQKGYATIADILPTAEKLSDIYGKTLDTYGQSEAEQEVFNSLASAQRKRQKLTQREIASFSGTSGTNRTSLTTSSVGQF